MSCVCCISFYLFMHVSIGLGQEECADGWEDVNPYSVQFDYPGDYSVELYVTNNLSSHYVLAALHVDQQVTYGQLTILPVNVNSASHMYLNITSGTRVTLTVDWQDTSTEQLYLENITDVVHLTHRFEVLYIRTYVHIFYIKCLMTQYCVNCKQVCCY